MSESESGHGYALPDDISEALRTATVSVSEQFAQACLTDPSFEFGLLVMAFMPENSSWREGEPWGARHWTGRQGAVRSEDVPRGLPLSRFADARPANAEWNLAWWMTGLKYDGSGMVMRVLTESVPDPLIPVTDGNWAASKIAAFDRDLAARD